MSTIVRFYNLLVGANLIDGVIATYLPLAAAASGASAAAVGLLSFFALLPWLISPIVGTFVDRFDAGYALKSPL